MNKNHYDFIVVGQGIAGTMLAYHIMKAEKSVLVIDDNHKSASSMVAAGLINPITGRKYVKSWKIDELFPYAKKVYRQLETELDINIYNERIIFRALYGPKEENLFFAKSMDPDSARYIDLKKDDKDLKVHIKDVEKFGAVKGAQVNLEELLLSFRKELIKTDSFYQEDFDYDELEVHEENVRYRNYTASHIIFAEGYRAANNPLFQNIEYDPAKGEVLLVRIPNASIKDIVRHKIFLIPIYDDVYWIGANYIWGFDDNKPSEEERKRLVSQLDSILNNRYEIVDHKAAIRPCLKGRRPKMGSHTQHDRIHIFTGMGTKGTSLAPYWANHFIDHLVHDFELDENVTIDV